MISVNTDRENVDEELRNIEEKRGHLENQYAKIRDCYVSLQMLWILEQNRGAFMPNSILNNKGKLCRENSIFEYEFEEYLAIAVRIKDKLASNIKDSYVDKEKWLDENNIFDYFEREVISIVLHEKLPFETSKYILLSNDKDEISRMSELNAEIEMLNIQEKQCNERKRKLKKPKGVIGGLILFIPIVITSVFLPLLLIGKSYSSVTSLAYLGHKILFIVLFIIGIIAVIGYFLFLLIQNKNKKEK